MAEIHKRNPLDVLSGVREVALEQGDCKQLLRLLPDNSIDSIVTDPPYELGFMGKGWDKTGIAYDVEMWAECLRVLKPGGHLLSFSGSRTYHRMACAIEDAGFEIRDQIMWVYGSGMPKSLNVSKAIDKAAGAERRVVSTGKAVKRMIPGADQNASGSWIKDNGREYVPTVTEAATPEAAQWEGWGTAMKPAHEPICVARKPLAKGMTVAANVLEWGTGAINIDGCRVPHVTVGDGSNLAVNPHLRTHINGGNGGHVIAHEDERRVVTPDAGGRWPANLIHDGSPEVVALFPADAGANAPVRGTEPSCASTGKVTGLRQRVVGQFHADAGSAARFFYCAKATRKDRNDGLPSSSTPVVAKGATMRECEGADWSTRNGNDHPTVKPTDLCRYLVRLVTPRGGVVLDPFNGSGSTGRGARLEGCAYIGFDLDPHHIAISEARIAAAEATAAKEAAGSAAKPKKAPRKPAPKKTAPAPVTAARQAPVQLSLLEAA